MKASLDLITAGVSFLAIVLSFLLGMEVTTARIEGDLAHMRRELDMSHSVLSAITRAELLFDSGLQACIDDCDSELTETAETIRQIVDKGRIDAFPRSEEWQPNWSENNQRATQLATAALNRQKAEQLARPRPGRRSSTPALPALRTRPRPKSEVPWVRLSMILSFTHAERMPHASTSAHG